MDIQPDNVTADKEHNKTVFTDIMIPRTRVSYRGNTEVVSAVGTDPMKYLQREHTPMIRTRGESFLIHLREFL